GGEMRRVAIEALEIFPVLAKALLICAAVARILRVAVIDRSVRDQSLERMRTTENRRGEITAEAAAAGRHPLRVDPRLRREPLGRFDRVLVGQVGPFLGDRIRPRLAEAARAVEVVPRRNVTPVR